MFGAFFALQQRRYLPALLTALLLNSQHGVNQLPLNECSMKDKVKHGQVLSEYYHEPNKVLYRAVAPEEQVVA